MSTVRILGSTALSPIRLELEPAFAAASTLPMEELPRLIGDLEQIRVIALARLTAPSAVSRADELVSIGEASRRLNVSKSYLYRHSGQFQFTRHVGRKLVFSTLGIDRYITSRR